jgi:hypothetical protein
VQDDVLARFPDRNLTVWVVWLKMLRSDGRDRWPRDEIVDRRARHLWDEGKLVGRALAAREELRAWRPVAWDIWAVYPPGVTWSGDAPVPAASGRTIIKTRNQLVAAVQALPAAPPR